METLRIQGPFLMALVAYIQSQVQNFYYVCILSIISPNKWSSNLDLNNHRRDDPLSKIIQSMSFYYTCNYGKYFPILIWNTFADTSSYYAQMSQAQRIRLSNYFRVTVSPVNFPLGDKYPTLLTVPLIIWFKTSSIMLIS